MTLHLGWPQIIWFALMFVNLCAAAYRHGKPRSAENFWVALIAAPIAAALLWWGGFFS